MKKIFISLSIILTFLFSIMSITACDFIKAGEFNLVAPDGAPVVALADMWGENFGEAKIEYNVTLESSLNAEFVKGTEFIVAPINIGANIHNAAQKDSTKYDYKLMNVTSWGVLYIISNENEYNELGSNVNEFLSQFDEKQIDTIGLQAIPGKTVDYLFKQADAQVTINGSEASTIQQKIKSNTAVTAVLGEPAITALKNSGAKFDVLASVSNAFNLVTGKDFPMAGMFVRADVAENNPALVSAINERISKSVKTFNDDPTFMKDKTIENSTLNANVIAQAAPKMNVKFKNSADSKDSVKFLLEKLGITVSDDLFIL